MGFSLSISLVSIVSLTFLRCCSVSLDCLCFAVKSRAWSFLESASSNQYNPSHIASLHTITLGNLGGSMPHEVPHFNICITCRPCSCSQMAKTVTVTHWGICWMENSKQSRYQCQSNSWIALVSELKSINVRLRLSHWPLSILARSMYDNTACALSDVPQPAVGLC